VQYFLSRILSGIAQTIYYNSEKLPHSRATVSAALVASAGSVDSLSDNRSIGRHGFAERQPGL